MEVLHFLKIYLTFARMQDFFQAFYWHEIVMLVFWFFCCLFTRFQAFIKVLGYIVNGYFQEIKYW